MARYSKTKPRKSLKTLQDKEFDRLKSARGDNSKRWGTEKMVQKHWKGWKKRHDAEVDRKWEEKEAKNKKWKTCKKKHDAEVEKKWKEKEAKKRKQVVDTDYLYGDWMKDKKK